MLELGASVVDAGFSLVPPHSPYPPKQHPEGHHFTWQQGRVLSAHALVYITHGQGVFESRPGGHRTLRAGDLFVLFPGVWHRYRPDLATGWNEYWVELEGDYAARLLGHELFDAAQPVIVIGQDDILLGYYLSLVETIRTAAAHFEYRAAGLGVQILFHILAAARGREAGGRGSELALERAKAYLLEHSNGPVDLHGLARKLGVGYSWFRQRFQKYTGFSPLQYHQQIRINRAASLLAGTTLPIGQIASQLGFESLYYFSRLFKQKTGCSPTQYRQEAYTRGGAPTAP
jgi:AraC-like DNA-binding protein